MFTVYSHQLATMGALVKAAIGEHGSFNEVIEILASEDDKIINTTESVFKELIELTRSDGSYEDPERYFDRIFADSYLATLYRYASEDVLEAIVISYLNSFTLSRITGKEIKGNKAITKIIENSILYLENTAYHNEDLFFSVFTDFYDGLVEDLYDDNQSEMVLDMIEDDKAWHHYRVLSLSCLRVMLAACRLDSNNDIEFGGRAGLLKMLSKQLEDLNSTLVNIFENIQSTTGVAGYRLVGAVPKLHLFEEGDLCPSGVVIFDKDTPLTDVFYNDLIEEHSSYNGIEDIRSGYLMAEGRVLVPFLTDEIRAECTTLTLHDVEG